MTSVNETNGNSLSKLDNGDIVNLHSEGIESAKGTAELLNNSFISVGEKSELYIKFEICEKLLEKEINKNNEIECVNNSHELPSENNEVVCVNNSHELPSENNEVVCVNNCLELPSENNEVVCVNNCHELLSGNNEVECVNNSHELPSENEVVCVNNSHELLSENNEVKCITNSLDLPFEENEVDINNYHELPSVTNVLVEEGFDLEIKKCCYILKCEEPTDSDALSILCESDIEASFEGELKLNDENPIENIASNVKCEKEDYENPIEKVPSNIKRKKEDYENSTEKVASNIKRKKYDENPIENVDSKIKGKKDDENPIENVDSNIKREKEDYENPIDINHEKDDDELSLFAETDVSTLEEYEISILECSISNEEKPSVEQNDAVVNKKTISSVVHVPETFESEAKDINDPGWELIKTLSTDEERYKQVQKCWGSSTIHNPNKDLTHHSYRKRHFQNTRTVPKPRKRAATSNLEVSKLNPAKRQRSCTFLYDQNIDSLSKEKNKEKQDLLKEMRIEINKLNNILFQQEERLQRQCDYYGRYNYNAYEQLRNLREKCQREIANVRHQYTSMANHCNNKLHSGINALNSARNEVLQFYSFYKGLNSDDPTVLTTTQLREWEDIEHVYTQIDKLYKE